MVRRRRYDDRMPKQPLFQTTRAQHLAIAGLMALFFTACVGVAAGYIRTIGSGLSSTAPGAAERYTVVAGLRVALPGGWERRPDAADGSTGLEAAEWFEDTERPGRALLIAALTTPEPVAPTQVATELAPQLLQQLGQGAVRGFSQTTFTRADDGLVGLEYVGVSLDRSSDALREHMLVTLTPDGRRHWLIYMTGLTVGPRFMEEMPMDLSVFRAIHRSATLAGEVTP